MLGVRLLGLTGQLHDLGEEITMETVFVIAALAAIIYALGHGNGRKKGASENVAQAVADLLRKR